MKIRIVETPTRLPVPATLSIESKDRTRIDLATLLSMQGLCKLVANYQHYSEDFFSYRKAVDFGIKAVPSGTYPEKNFFMLLLDKNNVSSMVEKEVHETTYIDWTRANVKDGDLLPVDVIEISDYKSVHLHPTNSFGHYVKELINEYDKILEESQVECSLNPPVFQPYVGLIVIAKVK